MPDFKTVDHFNPENATVLKPLILRNQAMEREVAQLKLALPGEDNSTMVALPSLIHATEIALEITFHNSESLT